MARLIRCDRCHREVIIERGEVGQIEVPVMSSPHAFSGDTISKDLCTACAILVRDLLKPLPKR